MVGTTGRTGITGRIEEAQIVSGSGGTMQVLHLLFRAIHTLAGAAWVGGSIFYLLVALPALRLGGPAPAVAAKMAALFKQLVNACVGVLLLSGVYLTFDRLTQTTLGIWYIVVLVIKIALALSMFMLAIYLGQSHVRRLAKHSTRLSKLAPQAIMVLGILIFILGAILNTIFEATIAPH